MSFTFEDKWRVPKFPSDHLQSDMFWENKSNLTRHHDTYPFIDPFRFKNTLCRKVVIITLAHRGIGRTTANAFAAAGASVVLVGPNADALQPVMVEIREKYGTPTLALTANVLDRDAPARIVHLAERHIGPIDILVNISPPAYIRPFTQEENMTDWWTRMECTVRAPIALIHAALPSMISRRTGTIITVTAVTGVLNIPFMSAEGVSNAAILKFHQQLHLETQPKGITCFAVHPGMIPSYLHDPDDTIVMRPVDFVKEPRMRTVLTDRVSEISWDAAGLASGTFVAMCADPRSKVLSGMYVSAGRDLGEMISAVEKDPGRIERERLYTMKVDEL